MEFDLQRFAIVPGRVGQWYAKAEEQDEYTKVGRLVDATLNASRNEDEATSHDSGEDEQFEPGRRNTTMTAEHRYDPDDPGQDILADAHFAEADGDGDTSDIKFFAKLEMKSGDIYEGEGFLTEHNPGSPNQGLAPINYTVRFNTIEHTEGS